MEVGGMGMGRQTSGIVEDITDGFKSILRPKSSSGKTLPASTVQIDLSDKTLAWLAVIVMGSAVAANEISKKRKK